MSRPYLFPVPGRVLRDLLDLKASLDVEFSEDDAAADLMLDLDLVAFYGRTPQPTGMLHAVRYYAERWSWPKSRVAEAWGGRAERTRSDGRVVAGVEPWIGGRIAEWRAFYAESAGHGQTTAGQRRTTAGQKPAHTGHEGASPDTVRQPPDSAGQPPDKQEQTPRPTDLSFSLSARPRGAPWEGEAVSAYAEIARAWPVLDHARAIARELPDPDPDTLRAWREHVTTWAATPEWNERNVPRILRSFSESQAAAEPPAGPALRRAHGVPRHAPRRGARRAFDE